MSDMLRYAKDYPSVYEAFPIEPKEIEKLPRPYVANVIYTLAGE